MLDVGTNNRAPLDDPEHIGWRHDRIEGEAYVDFVGRFVAAVEQELPGTLLWEDFATAHARPILDRYRDRLLTLNDDIQGIAAVVVGALAGALHRAVTAGRSAGRGAGRRVGRGSASPTCCARRWSPTAPRTTGPLVTSSSSTRPDCSLPIDGKQVPVAQCNNVFIFPTVGLGVVAAGTRRVTDGMLHAAAGARRTTDGVPPASPRSARLTCERQH